MGTYWSQNALTRCPKGLCLLLLLIAGIFPLASHAQNAGININLTDKPLSAFIQSIEQQTDFKFFYEQQQVDVKQHVTVNVTLSAPRLRSAKSTVCASPHPTAQSR